MPSSASSRAKRISQGSGRLSASRSGSGGQVSLRLFRARCIMCVTQREVECTALTWCALNPDGAALAFHQLLADGKTEADPALRRINPLAHPVAADEAVEDLLLHIEADAAPGILHFDASVIA